MAVKVSVEVMVKVAVEDEEVNPKHAVLSEPILGMEKVTWEDGKGPGALRPKALPSPRLRPLG